MKLPPQNRAFSLLEMLTVITVIVLLTTLVAPSFTNLGRANLLTTSGNKVVNLINYAGQNSLSKNAMTALVALAPDSKGYTTFALMEYVPANGEWRQLSGWETIRDGVVVDQCSFSDYPGTPAPVADFPPIKYQGKPVSNFKYIVFLPNRSLWQSTTAQIRFAEGTFAAGDQNPTYTRKQGDGTPANYYAVTVLNATGRPKIDRP